MLVDTRIRIIAMKLSGTAPIVAALLLASPCLAADCFVPAAGQAGPTLSLVAPEMSRPLRADPFCASVQDLLARLRTPVPASAPPGAATGTADAAAYVPRTKDDNTPWRFDMSQNGKRMTSAEFDAWMKAKGIRVATGKPGAGTAPAATPSAAPENTAPPATPQQ
jgi:hypothetical protein